MGALTPRSVILELRSKTGQCRDQTVRRLVDTVPPPSGPREAPPRARNPPQNRRAGRCRGASAARTNYARNRIRAGRSRIRNLPSTARTEAAAESNPHQAPAGSAEQRPTAKIATPAPHRGGAERKKRPKRARGPNQGSDRPDRHTHKPPTHRRQAGPREAGTDAGKPTRQTPPTAPIRPERRVFASRATISSRRSKATSTINEPCFAPRRC